MEVYELFDDYLQKSKAIRAFCESREQLLFESVRMDIPSEGKVRWLESVGAEILEVIALIEKIESAKTTATATTKPVHSSQTNELSS